MLYIYLFHFFIYKSHSSPCSPVTYCSSQLFLVNCKEPNDGTTDKQIGRLRVRALSIFSYYYWAKYSFMWSKTTKLPRFCFLFQVAHVAYSDKLTEYLLGHSHSYLNFLLIPENNEIIPIQFTHKLKDEESTLHLSYVILMRSFIHLKVHCFLSAQAHIYCYGARTCMVYCVVC
jgi:hypothetical protein